MNVGWDHLGAGPGAWDGVAADLPPFADAAAVGALLGCPAEAVGIENVWFIPGRSLQVVYRAGQALRVVAYGERTLARDLLDDPGLPALRGLLDPARATLRAGRTVTDVDLLAYLPGERCAARWRGPDVDLVAKISRKEDLAASDARQRALFALPGRSFLMPEPLGVDADGVRVERAVPGRRAEALIGEVAPEDLLRALAASVTGFAAIPPAGHQPNGAAEIVRRMRRKVVPRVADALPALRPRLGAFLDRLDGAAPPPGQPVVIHGDLHTANVLFGAGLVPAFVDLDSLAVGDTEFDLALFASRMMLLGAVGGTEVRLPEGYAGPDEERFRWYLAATLVGRQMKTCVRHLAPGLAGLCESLLTEAEALLR